MKAVLATVLALVVVFSSFAQKTTPTIKAIHQIERKADSINAALNTSFKTYHAKVDSLNKEKLIEALKNSNELQNGNNTYYSVPIALMTFIVTVFVVVLGYNAFSVAETHKKEMREQQEATFRLLKEQKEHYDSRYNELSEGYTKVVKGYADFEEKYKNALEKLTSNAEEKLKALESATIDGSDAAAKTQKEIEEVKKVLEEVRNMQQHLNNTPPKTSKNVDDAVLDYLSQRARGESLFGKINWKMHPIVCPHCKKHFSPLTAQKIALDPIISIYTCPHCKKGIEVRDHTT